jgi:hypothetical protein
MQELEVFLHAKTDHLTDSRTRSATMDNQVSCKRVDLLPPLFLSRSPGKLVLERSEVGKSCLRQNATSFAEDAKKCRIASREIFLRPLHTPLFLRLCAGLS